MTTFQLTYNPGILGDQELIRSFVVRQQSLELILEALRENASSSGSNRHLLLIGPRGIGKTMLVRRAAAEVRANSKYGDGWYPLVFGEESYSVSSAGEFWLEAIFHLADQTGDVRIQKTFEDLKEEHKDSSLRDRALGQLLDFADREKKRILLVVENLNTVMGEQMSGDAAWELRHTLQNEPRLMLLGTATNRFDDVKDIGHAWFEMFSLQQIQPLNLDECRELWRSVTGSSVDRNPLRAIKILTGGYPRLITILGSFAVNHSFRQLMEQLVHLIDDHTEYFKGHLDSIRGQERKVFVALLDLWDPVGASDVSRQTRLSVNEVSVMLGRLCDRGTIEVLSQKGRKKLYQVSERLYNIYYLMRRRGHPEGRVQAAVRFMITFYERDELIVRLAEIAREACALSEDNRKDHICAYREILRRSPKLTVQIMESSPPEFFRAPDTKSLLETGTSSLVWEAHDLYHRDQYQESERLYRKALQLDENSASAWSGLAGVMFDDPTRISETEFAIRRSLELRSSGEDWHNLGIILTRQTRWNEAEHAFAKAVELLPSDAYSWTSLGYVRLMQEQLLEAEQADRMAIQLEPNNASHWNDLAIVLWTAGRTDEATQALYKAVELDPNSPNYWQALGHRLLEIGPREEAERVWTEALRLHSEELASCSIHLLELWMARGVRHEAILQEAADWVTRSKYHPSTLAVIAKFLVCEKVINGLHLAELWANQAFAAQQNSQTSESLSLVLSEMKKWQESIRCSKPMLDECGKDEETLEMGTDLVIRAAAGGYAKEALEAVRASKGAPALEPLSVGLQIFLGEEPIVAKEILEIGRDVAERIRNYKIKYDRDAKNNYKLDS